MSEAFDNPSLNNESGPGFEHTADGTRRDFIVLAASATAAVGAASCIWPFISSMNPSADVLALSSTEVNISSIQPGQEITVVWRGKPVFVRNRTPEEVAEANKVDVKELRDPQTDEERTKKGHENWLIMIGICTHLGCIPLSQKDGTFFCPCHGSQYDTSGRIRKGPAPKNLAIPPYQFVSASVIKIG